MGMGVAYGALLGRCKWTVELVSVTFVGLVSLCFVCLRLLLFFVLGCTLRDGAWPVLVGSGAGDAFVGASWAWCMGSWGAVIMSLRSEVLTWEAGVLPCVESLSFVELEVVTEGQVTG
jgi:hypothetical protein